MKKGTLVIVLLMLAFLQLTAQSGQTCAQSQGVTGTISGQTYDYPISNGISWLSFNAPASAVLIAIDKTANTSLTQAAITQLVLYSGSCSNAQALATHTVVNTDSMPSVNVSGLTTGQTYYLKVTAQNTTSTHYGLVMQDRSTVGFPIEGCPGLCYIGADLAIDGNFEANTANTPAFASLQSPVYASPTMYQVNAFAALINNSATTPPNQFHANRFQGGEYCIGNAGVPGFSSVLTVADNSNVGNNGFYYGDCDIDGQELAAWKIDIPVQNGKYYQICFYAKDVLDANFPANKTVLKVKFNGQTVSNGTISSSAWRQAGGFWQSNVTGTIPVEITCTGGNAIGGFDFGLDDITVGEASQTILAPGLTLTSNVQTLCGSVTSATITASSIYSNTTYLWNTGQTTSAITVSPNITTTYVCTATVGGCSQTQSFTIYVQRPTPYILANDYRICQGQTVTFTNNTVNPLSPVTYLWNFGDGTPTSNAVAPSHTYNLPGTFTVTLTATNSCGSASTTLLIEVLPSNSAYNANCCSENLTYSIDETVTGRILLSGTVNWNNQQSTIRGWMVLAAGCTLNITNGSVIQFEPLSGIQVRAGAVLNVNGSTLRGLISCGTMWQGVEVLGTSTQNQITPNPANGLSWQGSAIFTNATVRDAHNAVVAGFPTGSSFNNALSGGYVSATGTQFINNGVGVKFAPYIGFANTSVVQNCSFSSATLLDPGYTVGNPYGYSYTNANNAKYAPANATGRTHAFVSVNTCRNVKVNDNTLTNAEYGIYGLNSRVTAINADNIGNANEFANMNYGIFYTYSMSTLFGNRIEKNTFDNITTTAPIYIVGGSSDRVIKNIVNTTQVNGNSFVGMGFAGCQSLYVVDNEINNCLIGVGASATATQGGLIGFATTGNVFTNCANGTWVTGSNPGLQIRCNKYNNPTTAYIRNWYASGGLANQGVFPATTDKHPAGNDLNPNNAGVNDELYSTTLFNYYFHTPSAAYPATQPDVSLIAGNVLTTANFVNTGFAKNNTSCDPVPCNPPCNQLPEATQTVANLQTELAALVIDGNQTQYLLAAISSATDKEQLKTLLLNNSPLSCQVLQAYIASGFWLADQFSSVMVTNSPVSKTVRPPLFAVLPGLPSANAAAILNAQSNYSNRTPTVVRGELETARIKRQNMVNDALNYYVENDSITAAKNLLAGETNFGAKQMLAATYMAEGDYTAAAGVLNAMTPCNAAEQNLLDLYNLLNTLYSAGRSVNELTSAEEQTVRGIATATTPSTARSNARVILFVAFGEPIPFEFNPDGSGSREMNPETDEVPETLPLLGSNYPNPFNQQTVIPCAVPENSTGVLSVFDVNGKLVVSRTLTAGVNTVELDTQNWEPGVYMYALTINGKQQQVRKMVLIR